MSIVLKLFYLGLLALPAATNPVPPDLQVEEEVPGIPDGGIVRHYSYRNWPWWRTNQPSWLPSYTSLTASKPLKPSVARTVITTTTEFTTIFTTDITTVLLSSSASKTASNSSLSFTNSSSAISPTSTIVSTTSGASTSPNPARCSSTASPPAPTQPGMVSGCSKYYVADVGDFCYSIAEKFGIDVNTFMGWNPAVLAPDCTELLSGDAYCVQVCGNTSLTSVSATFTPLPSSTVSAPVPSLTPGPDDVYHAYCGDGSVAEGWPSQDQWLEFDNMFDLNKNNMRVSCEQWNVPYDTDQEIEEMKDSIVQVAEISGIDSRFILAIIMQESAGCVRVITTSYSHNNPGLMQSFNGSGTCNTNQAPLGIGGTSASNIQTPCPGSEIRQMILDGANGTVYGDGLRQNFAEQNQPGATGYYRTAKIYNGGINSLIENENSLESGCCTISYVSDIANRLTGWVNAARNFNC